MPPRGLLVPIISSTTALTVVPEFIAGLVDCRRKSDPWGLRNLGSTVRLFEKVPAVVDHRLVLLWYVMLFFTTELVPFEASIPI